MDQATSKLQTLRQDTQQALESVMQHFLESADKLPPPEQEEEKMDINEDGSAGTGTMLICECCSVSFANHRWTGKISTHQTTKSSPV